MSAGGGKGPRGRLVAVLAACAIGLLALSIAVEVPWAALRKGKSHELPKRPNVVLMVSDDQPIRSFREMPYLSSRNWTRFPNAVVNNPLCCPSRTTILTGLYSHRTGVETNDFASRFDDSRTIATALQERGYETAFVGKYLNDYPWDKGAAWRPQGWDRWFAMRRHPDFYDYRLNVDGKLEKRGSQPADFAERVIRSEALRWLREHEDDPFFLVVSTYAPHYPSLPEPGDEGKLDDIAVPIPPSARERDVSDKPRFIRKAKPVAEGRIRRVYKDRSRSALAVDRTAEALMDALEDAGEADDTVFIYLTDHGFALGEHRRFGKKCGYEECIRTPLLIKWPGAPDRVGEPVSNADIAPTIAAITGATLPYDPDGRSLAPLMEGRSEPGRAVLLRNAETGENPEGRPEFWGVRTRRHKYLRHSDGTRELYDLRRDPWELENVAGKRRSRALERRLAAEIRRLRDG